MLWRKKKLVEPHALGIPAVTRQSAPGQSTRLAMTEVYALCYAAGLQRGYPGAVADAIAGRVLWLERRGLPGVVAMTREFVTNKELTPVERGTNCPFIAGTLLMDQFDLFVGHDAERQLAIAGPTNGLLIVPKVAEFAARIGETVRISWLKGEPPEVFGEMRVGSDGTVACNGDVTAALFNSGVAFVRDSAPVVSTASHFTSAVVPDDVIAALISFIGRYPLEMAIKAHKLLSEDATTLALLHMLSDSDRAQMLAVSKPVDGQPERLLAAAGSATDRLCARFASYGWTALNERHAGAHCVSDEGREALPMVVRGLDRFPPTRH